MSALRSYLKVRMKGLVRTWTEEWATYFILAPVMIGAVFLLGRRIFHDFASKIGTVQSIAISQETLLQGVLAVLSLKIFFNFLPLSKRLYPTEQSLTIDDLLPIRPETRYVMFYIEQLIRDFPFFLFALFAVLFFDKPDLIGWVFTFWLFFPGMEIGLTILWNHLHPPSRAELLLALFILLWLIWFLPIESMGWWLDFAAPFLVTVGFWGFGRWRYSDVSGVEQLLLESQSKGNLLNRIGRWLPESVRPLVVRDFQLTLRNFAPLFWRNLAIAFILVAAVVLRGNIPPAVFCAGAVYFLSATASTLFALQRPYRAMDYILPLAVERIWRGKVLYAVFLSSDSLAGLGRRNDRPSALLGARCLSAVSTDPRGTCSICPDGGDRLRGGPKAGASLHRRRLPLVARHPFYRRFSPASFCSGLSGSGEPARFRNHAS
ncbi:MAG: hypothetical protein MPW14_01660 [Candidatus Manganitrophus sp.]|nr:MAG: hypothetical protein MPW14_01660 [Candidatus Manganitrophus sp.]